MKLNDTHQPLVYAEDGNILGGSVHTVKEITETLVVTCKPIGLELNANKTKHMVRSRDQNSGRIQNILPAKGWSISNINLKDQNSIHEEINTFAASYLNTQGLNNHA